MFCVMLCVHSCMMNVISSEQGKFIIVRDEQFDFEIKCPHFSQGIDNNKSLSMDDKLTLEFDVRDNLSDKYVCLRFFRREAEGHRLTLTCTVSVKDVEGNLRFTRSFACTDMQGCFDGATLIDEHVNKAGKFVLIQEWTEEYVRKQTLLDSSDELLPNDTLTIVWNVHFTFIIQISTLLHNPNQSQVFKIHSSNGGELNLEPATLEKLCLRSTVFETIFCSEWLKGEHVTVTEESNTLLFLFCYLHTDALEWGMFEDWLYFEELAKLYLAADKYFFDALKQDCEFELKRLLETIRYSDEEIAENDTILQFFDDADMLSDSAYIKQYVWSIPHDARRKEISENVVYAVEEVLKKLESYNASENYIRDYDPDGSFPGETQETSSNLFNYTN